jgi:hypothetical protein
MARLRRDGLMPAIAAGCGVQVQAVRLWDVVPLHRVVEVEAVTGIPREELRPDFHRYAVAQAAAE